MRPGLVLLNVLRGTARMAADAYRHVTDQSDDTCTPCTDDEEGLVHAVP
jgi:hypothetical protein